MSQKSQLARIVASIEKRVPKRLQTKVLSFAIGRTVKLFGTTGLECLQLTPTRSEFRIRNRKKVQNHIGGIHAAGMALVAETATGMVLGMNLPKDKVPVIKTLNIDYTKRCSGDLTAIATLTDQQIETIKTLDKGEINVPVVCTDSAGKEPIHATMIWAWTPKRR